MNCSDFNAHLHDYIDGELAADAARALEAHAAACPACAAELASLRTLRDATAQLDRELAPSRDLWRGIAAGISAGRATGSRAAGNMIAFSTAKRSPLYWFAPLGLAAGIAFLAILGERAARPAASEGGWAVAAVEGAPRVAARRVQGQAQLRVGQWLVTDAASRARLDVGAIGFVNVEQNSRLRLVDTSATDHRLELARGTLSAMIYAPPRIFFVDTPSATAVDLGCAYTLAVDDDGHGELHVTSGYVALEHGGRESIVPAGVKCMTRRGAGPGTPYATDASAELRTALERFDFGRGAGRGTLAAVLAAARADDAITLWHLLARTDAAGRGEVFDALAKSHPAPAGVTRAGIVAGDAAMRKAWAGALGLASYTLR